MKPRIPPIAAPTKPPTIVPTTGTTLPTPAPINAHFPAFANAFFIPPSADPPKNPPRNPLTLEVPHDSDFIHPVIPSSIAMVRPVKIIAQGAIDFNDVNNLGPNALPNHVNAVVSPVIAVPRNDIAKPPSFNFLNNPGASSISTLTATSGPSPLSSAALAASLAASAAILAASSCAEI